MTRLRSRHLVSPLRRLKKNTFSHVFIDTKKKTLCCMLCMCALCAVCVSLHTVTHKHTQSLIKYKFVKSEALYLPSTSIRQYVCLCMHKQAVTHSSIHNKYQLKSSSTLLLTGDTEYANKIYSSRQSLGRYEHS